jgi:hypothetical protein
MVAEVSGRRDPGTLDITLTGKVEVLCKVRICPALTLIMTVPVGVLVNSSGKRVNAEKQDPGTGIPSKNRERDQAGTGAGKGGVNCPWINQKME